MSSFREESIPSIQDAVEYFYGSFPDGKVTLEITKDMYVVSLYREKDDQVVSAAVESRDAPISITICGLTQQLVDSAAA